MDTVFVEFTVRITESEYAWDVNEKGESILKLEIPKDYVGDVLDIGGTFNRLFATALVKFENLKVEDKENE